MLTSRIGWEKLRSIDSTTFTGSYQDFGVALLYPSYKLKVVNNSNVLITISIDGIDDIDVAPPNSYWLYDETMTINHEFLPGGTQIYIKGTSGPSNSGNVYLVSQYLKPAGY